MGILLLLPRGSGQDSWRRKKFIGTATHNLNWVGFNLQRDVVEGVDDQETAVKMG